MTAGGKNVAPAVLEDRLRAHVLVDQCLVVGDGQPFIAALVTIDRETFPAWAEQHGKSGDIDAPGRRPRPDRCHPERRRRGQQGGLQGRGDPQVHDPPDEWTEEGGQLTPSLKLKRNVVMRQSREPMSRRSTSS